MRHLNPIPIGGLLFSSLFFLASMQAQTQMRFVDSATGISLQPLVRVFQEATEPRELTPTADGRLVLHGAGSATLEIASPDHQPLSVAVNLNDPTFIHQFELDPLTLPQELTPKYIVQQHRADSTVFLGHVVGDDTGQPVEGVLVSAEPEGGETFTDARGFFQLTVPLKPDSILRDNPARLIFSKDGYKSEERRHVELLPYGDWTLRVRLEPGSGSKTVLERTEPRFHSLDATGQIPDAAISQPPASSEKFSEPASATSPTNATVRIPRNIRVLSSDNVTIIYVSMENYVARVLSSEWISSWANYTGGMNSLMAGAVAIRSYAAYHVNNAGSSSTYDICATTSCQVYGSTTTGNASTATTQTEGYVVLGSNNTISRSEYSAENNSLGFSCGDGYTQPTGGCIYDPVCTGETRYGHGRGMCQWGTARWATGRRMANRTSGDATPTGHPKQDWVWIVNQYYPTLTMVQAKPLVIGDDVKVVGSSSRTTYMCGDGSISSGVNCPSTGSKAVGSTGVIISGPVQVTSDGRGFTWWKISWSDSTTNWLPENWLERVIPAPVTPTNLRATAVATNQINLTWNSALNSFEMGFKIERSVNVANNWVEIDTVGTNALSYSDTTVLPATTNYYRIRSYNLGGNSAYSNTTNAVTPGLPPVLTAIANRTVAEGSTLTITNSATAPDFVTPLTDFESYGEGVAAMFRTPTYSGSTASHLDATPNTASVSGTFPANAKSGSFVFKANWSYKTGTTNPWLRLTTAGAANLPNPVMDFTKKLQFDMHTDKSLQVALGCRETSNPAGTPIGSDGGSTGGIEFVGVNGKNGSAPNPTRTVPANTWTTLTFNIPAEPAAGFTGDGVLTSATGLGVLEHLAFVPAAGMGAYTVYLDNFAVAQSKVLTYSLDAGAPAGASISPSTGVFTWTPAEAQGPGTYNITVRVTDNASPPQSDSKTFSVTVTEVNSAPILSAISNKTVNEGTFLSFTASATDLDIPANSLSYSLDAGAPAGASINSSSGLFTWTPTEAQGPGTYNITVRATDNGVPAMSDAKIFSITVNEVNIAPALTAIANRTVHAGTLVTFTNIATDSDFPANILTFSLDTAPPGASVNGTSGVYTWTPSDNHAGGTYSNVVRVSDNGSPTLSDTKQFTVTVQSRLRVQSLNMTNGNATIGWDSIPGRTYRVQYKNTLSDPAWITLGDVTASGNSSTRVDAGPPEGRYYRIMLMD